MGHKVHPLIQRIRFIKDWNSKWYSSKKDFAKNIRDDLKRHSPEIPILSTNPDSIYDNLKLLIENPKLRLDLGKRGRQYAEKYHDAEKVTLRILKVYEEIK